MPLSIKTLENLNLEIEKNKRESKAVFVGSLYEPRTTILNQIKNELQKNNFDLEIKARVLGGPRISDEEYWKQIYNSSIVVTTVDQVEADGFDWSWNKQLVYRFLEATASGTLLLAPYVKGSERYFKANIDYHLYSSIEEAVEKISYFLSNPSILHEVSLSGKNKAETLIRAKTYWMQIDNALGKKGFQI
jgi:glycosyltransferase involved in cell wall biosynthesis